MCKDSDLNSIFYSKRSMCFDTPQTLITRDSIISGANQKGLRNKVECQPVSGALVDLLLEKIKIYDLKIDDINEVIKTQSDIHGGTFIDINKTFYNKNNQLKSHFYKPICLLRHKRTAWLYQLTHRHC